MSIFRTSLPAFVVALGLLVSAHASHAQGEGAVADSWQHTPIKVLMIGDSLTVGPFGDTIEAYLLNKYGRNGMALYASCGSSPESWLRDEHDFVTRCGFRYASPIGSATFDFENGHPPRKVLTPKIDALVAGYRPSVVVVQLGTNWMDAIVESGPHDARYRSIVDRFIAAIRCRDCVHQIIWITPPDHSHYSAKVKANVDELLKGEAQSCNFEIIDSLKVTHYVLGQTGSDGVHYNTKPAHEWANNVLVDLEKRLRSKNVAALEP